MAKLWRSPAGLTVVGLCIAAGEAILLVGLPDLKRWYPVIGFCAFVLVVGRLVYIQNQELARWRGPHLIFKAHHSETKQQVEHRRSEQYVIMRRISITNDLTSAAVAKDCELILVSCSFEIPSLTPDTALPVKDGGGSTKTDINRGDTKYFDLFQAQLTPKTDWPERSYVCAPNSPEVPRFGTADYVMVFRLTGSNFTPRMWNAIVTLGEGDARIKRLVSLDSDVLRCLS